MPDRITMHRPILSLPKHKQRDKNSPPRLMGRARQERNARLARNNPLCVMCAEKGWTEAATEWDHKVPLHLGGVDHESNLQGLCHECHREKTGKEATARANGTAVQVSPVERKYTIA